MLWDALFELTNRLLKVLDVWFDIGEELVQQVADIVSCVQIEWHGDALFVLVEDSSLAVLKDGVDQGIFTLNLLGNLLLQTGFWSLGLPIATSDTELVNYNPIWSNLAQRHLRGQ